MSINKYEGNSEIIGEILNNFTPMPLTKEHVLNQLNKTKPSKDSAQKELNGILKKLENNPDDYTEIEENEFKSIISALRQYLKKLN